MAIFPLLRWTQQHQKFVRALDYVLGLAAIGYGLWADSWISIGVGVFCMFAAMINLAQKFNMFLPRILSPKNPPDA